MSGIPGARCTAKVRNPESPNYGMQCQLPPIPFGKVCTHHGGWLPSVRAAAEREYLAFLRGERGYVSEWQKAEAMRSWERAQKRYAKRLDKKYGIAKPQKVPKRALSKAAEPAENEKPDPFKYEGWN